ncbi:MAG: hypothetical protein QF486_02505 [Candidatus Woesearchaeota archaeon]|nr:hypothetical protein [Candidatus Woesearchaeota archaeon]MDP7198466.1 hypothetical protein [Candidatus Woesearchaeota archaeon]MDP7466792.1 hypothetical protein [Candidatus Woesearchaeota archaeon]MDP7648017.1 hypothetical protein [Candidatus Woesearchaeota archaeon]
MMLLTIGCHTVNSVRSVVLPYRSTYFPNTFFQSQETEKVASRVFQSLYDSEGTALSPEQAATYIRTKWNLRTDRRGDEFALEKGGTYIEMWEARRVHQIWDKADHMRAIENIVKKDADK